MSGCPGCGLFLGHVDKCSGVVAVYLRYYARDERAGFQSVTEAYRFLEYGEDEGNLSSYAIRLPDGTEAYNRERDGRLSDWTPKALSGAAARMDEAIG